MDRRDRDEKFWDEKHSDDTYFPCGVDYGGELRRHYDDEEAQLRLGLTPTGLDGRFLDLRKKGKAWSILDLGAGYGDFGAYLAPHVRTYVGVDISKVIVDKGNAAIREAGIKNMFMLQAQNGTLDCLRDRDFDLVFSTGVFIHIAQYQARAYLKELPRILKPDGRFVIHINMGLGNNTLHDDRTVQLYSEDGYEALFKDTGLKILETWDQAPFRAHCFARQIYGKKA